MVWTNLIAGLLLFWPAVLILFVIAFSCIVFAVFLIGSTVVLSSIFLYGLYCILRDLGLLDWLFSKIGSISNYISTSVQQNVKQSFRFEMERQFTLEKPALYLCHPHGLYGITWFLYFSTCIPEWPLEERPVLAVHSIFFRIPILRELFIKNNCIEATESEIRKTLAAKKSVALLVGGIEELQYTEAGSMKLVLEKRKGYARIAKEMNVPLVPLLSPRENDLFPATKYHIWKSVQSYLYRMFHIAIPLPSLQSLWSWLTIAYQPFQTPYTTYILEPLYPDENSIEEIKSAYKKKLLDFSQKNAIALCILS